MKEYTSENSSKGCTTFYLRTIKKINMDTKTHQNYTFCPNNDTFDLRIVEAKVLFLLFINYQG